MNSETNELIKKLIKEEKPVRLNIACGQQKVEGFIGIDKVKTEATDIVWDLESYPWSFVPDNCVDEITISHYVEHVVNLPRFMDEIYRVMKSPWVNKEGEKVNSKVTIVCPYYSSMRAMQDPMHIRPISEASFLYYNKDWRAANKLDHYGIKSDFDYQYGYSLMPEWASRSQEARDFAIRHYMNVITDIYVTMTKK
jgi:hypothetical protein